VSARVVQMSNAAAFGPLPKPIGDVKAAIARIGFAMVKSVAVAVALQQLLAAKDSRAFPKRAEAAWRHSLAVAALAHLLARRLTRIVPDEALFAGLVHDIGYFYLLSRAPRYPGIEAAGTLDGILEEWHGPIGASVLHSFNLSDATLEAVAEHENGIGHFPMRTIADVVKTANALTAATNPIHLVRHEVPPAPAVDASITELVVSSQAELRAMEAELSR
jgi:putative nucleotidyltransferase with HDIG domain